jgi:hypothetical protein
MALALGGPTPEASAQQIYIGPGGIGFGVGDVPRYRNDYYYGPRGPYYDDYGYRGSPSYRYRDPYGYRYRSRDVDDFDTEDWVALGLGVLGGSPRYYYGERYYSPYPTGRYYNYSTPAYSNLNSPRYSYSSPTPTVVAPTQQQLDQLSWNDLRRVIENGVSMLQQDLNRFDTGDQWRTFLRIDQTQNTVAEDRQGPPAQSTVDALTPVLDRYQRIATESEYRIIADLPGFQFTHAVLDDYLEPASQRQRRVLASSATILNEALDGLSTGDGWRNYLSVADLADTSADGGVGALETALSRFQQVAGDPDYRAVAQLDGFTATRLALEDLLVFSGTVAGSAVSAGGGGSAADGSGFELVDPLEQPAP